MQPLKTLKPFQLSYLTSQETTLNIMYVIAPFEKKIKNFFFQKKSCDWIIFFQVSRFECPHCSRLLIVPYFQ